MTENINKSFIKKHEFDIGTFYFYENFVVGKVKKGQDLTFDSGQVLYEYIGIYYKNTIPFVYISDRVNSYSFKPTRLHGSEEHFPNLKGYAIVTYDAINTKVAELEQTFTSMPTAIFDNLEDAMIWSEKIILTT